MKRAGITFLLVAAATVLVVLPALARGRSKTSTVADMAGAGPTTTAAEPVPPPSAANGVYKKPSLAQLKKTLTPMEFYVTQENGTEAPFNNAYWNNHRAGIYVDVVSGEPLFSSTDKFDSGTGWPSFTSPLAPGNIVEKTDTSFGPVRTEVRSYFADSHLGHLFNDGPAPTGLRYCIDSAALRFIPVADLQKDGYGQYLSLFQDKTGSASTKG